MDGGWWMVDGVLDDGGGTRVQSIKVAVLFWVEKVKLVGLFVCLFVSFLVGLLVCLFVCFFLSFFLSFLVGWLVGLLVCLFVCFFLSFFLSWLVCWLVCCGCGRGTCAFFFKACAIFPKRWPFYPPNWEANLWYFFEGFPRKIVHEFWVGF